MRLQLFLKTLLLKYYCSEHSREQKAKGIPMGFEISDKKVNKQTDKDTFSYIYNISKDVHIPGGRSHIKLLGSLLSLEFAMVV